MGRSDFTWSLLPEDDPPFVRVDDAKLVVAGTSGIRRPGSPATISAYWTPAGPDLEFEFEVKLSTVDEQGQSPVVIASDVVWVRPTESSQLVFEADLPATAPAFYVIEAAVTLAEREWTVRRYMLVPKQVVDAELVSGRDPRAAPDQFVFEIVNRSPTSLVFGTPYELERLHGDAWVNCNVDSVWEASRLGVDPGTTLEQVALLPANAAAGRYRITKNVRAIGTPLEATLILEFELSD